MLWFQVNVAKKIAWNIWILNERDDEFQKNGVSQCPISPNSKDYESSNDEGQDDALSPNSIEYKGSSDKGWDITSSISK